MKRSDFFAGRFSVADRAERREHRPTLSVVGDKPVRPAPTASAALLAVAVLDAKYRLPLRDSDHLGWTTRAVAVDHLEGGRALLSMSKDGQVRLDERGRVLLGRGTSHWQGVEPGQRVAVLTDPEGRVARLVSATALIATFLEEIPA